MTLVRRKLLILLGAGASVSVGLPGVRQVDEQMSQWAATEGVFDNNRIVPNYYNLSWEAVGQHYAGARESNQNFETALAQMLALANWVRPHPHGRPLRDLIGQADNIPEFFRENRLVEMSPSDFGPYTSVATLYAVLLGKLADYMRSASQRIASENPAGVASYNSIMSNLRERFDVGIYSLNYDTLALQASPGAYVGFSDARDDEGCRLFDPGEVHRRPNWDFLYHLHGSVHYTLPAFGSGKSVSSDGIRWRDDLSGEFTSSIPGGGSIRDDRSDGTEIPATSLIAGGQKLDQLMGEPFQAMYGSLMRHAHEADAFLIAGYGFGDMHVNSALLSRMMRPGAKPPVMILEWTDPSLDPLAFRADGWPHRLRYALGLGGQNFDHIPGNVKRIRENKWFEQAHHHIAVWHDGFLQALDRFDAILDCLDGNWDAITNKTTE